MQSYLSQFRFPSDKCGVDVHVAIYIVRGLHLYMYHGTRSIPHA